MKKIFLALLILFAGVFFIPQCHAEDFIKPDPKKDYKAEISKLEANLAKNPDSYETYCLLGINYGLAGDIEKAQKILQEAVKKYPDKWNAYTFLADIKRAQNLFPPAIDLYKKAISLPSMPKEGKTYYTNLINAMIEEQKVYESKPKANQIKKTNIKLNLDMNKWQQVYLKGTSANWILEYGLKGENVEKYQWTKLITINFFDSKTYGFEPKSFCTKFLSLLKQQADSLGEELSYNIISAADNDIYLKWSISKRNECEICRIFKHNKGLYVVHFTVKKKTLAPNETNEITNILKSAKVI